MKKVLLLFTLFAGLTQIYASNEIVVSPVTIPQGKTGLINIELNNDETFTAFTFKLTLPEGLSYVLDESEEGKPKATFVQGSRFTDHAVSSSANGQVATFGCLSISSAPISGSNGLLLSVYVTSDDDMEVGEELTATLTEVTFTTPSEVEYALPDVNITITIGEDRLVFDENATALPTYTAGEKGNVKMFRTIQKDTWSTIVLPFNLTKANATSVFGSDVQMAKFTGFEVDYGEDEENVVPLGITINFTSYTIPARGNLAGGTPILIKTSKDITEPFTFDEVTLTSDITEQTASDEYGTSGKFAASLVKTKVPADGLFISDNKFWYSTGKTNIKAFRGWFELGAVLDKETDFGVKMYVYVDDDATRVEGIESEVPTEAVYDIMGRKVSKPGHKGVYIVGGKKILFK